MKSVECKDITGFLFLKGNILQRTDGDTVQQVILEDYSITIQELVDRKKKI